LKWTCNIGAINVLCNPFVGKKVFSEIGCGSLSEEIVKRPDPSIYDQKLELSQGRIPTWDNPDISSHQQMTVTDPQIVPLENMQASIHNRSAEAHAFNTIVRVEWSKFGIGLQRNQLGSINVNLLRAGSVGDTVQISLPLPSDLRALVRFAIFVNVNHPHDMDITNNEGEQAFDGKRTSEFGRSLSFTIPVRNPMNNTLTLNMGVIPTMWSVNFNPSSFALNPGQERNVIVTFDIPQNIPADIKEVFDIYSTHQTGLLGGVQLIIIVDS
jgi:hypothetical protein